MALTHQEKLASALQEAQTHAVDNIVQSSALTGPNRTLLVKEGFLKLIIKSWYLLDADIGVSVAGDSVLWYEGLWSFIGQYVSSKYAGGYWLSPVDSLNVQTSNTTLPKQLIINTTAKASNIISLPKGLSLCVVGGGKLPSTLELKQGVMVHTLESALANLLPKNFIDTGAIQIGLTKSDTSQLALGIADNRNMKSGNRLLGAYFELGMDTEAEMFKTQVRALAGLELKPSNPFEHKPNRFTVEHREAPSAMRVRQLWANFRGDIVAEFEGVQPSSAFYKTDIETVLTKLDEIHVQDAYHSLSIEGYRVTTELIEKIRSGQWSPNSNDQDKANLNVLAAKGYNIAFNRLKDSIRSRHAESGNQTGLARKIQLGVTQWYTGLFQPQVDAGMLTAISIAGFRKGPIYIRGSRHVPLPSEQLMDCMSALYQLCEEEPNALVRAVLAHFCLGYIHPFSDGNGRTARFLMNFLLLVNGYPWTLIKLENRKRYMECLEAASCDKDIKPFAKFIRESMSGSPS